MPNNLINTNNTYLTSIYDMLFQKYGPQYWWPGDTPFEIVIGAILTQNTSWGNVALAIKNIKNAGLLNPEALYNLNKERLSELIRPSGYFRIKTKRLKHFIEHLFLHHNGELGSMFNQGLQSLRKELLEINGIGPETADSIILYAAKKPVFVVDGYTKRIFSRHGFFSEKWDYSRVQSFFMESLPENVDIYNEYHALIVKLAKEYCKKKPICKGCPLEKEK